MSFRLSGLGLLLFLALFTSCGNSERKNEAQPSQRGGGGPGGQRPPVRAEAITVKATTLLNKIEVPGTIVANEATEVHPEVAGLITGIYFKEGATVSKGTVLFRLNDADLQAQLRKLQVQQSIAGQNENRSSQLLKIGGISREEYEASQLQVSNTSADIAVTRAQIAKTVIRAPFTGKVGLRLVSLGAYVSPTTVMTTISQVGQMKIDFTVPEKYIPQIKNGQLVNFSTEGTNRAYTARVSATESNITETTRTLQVRAIVQGNSQGLTPGNFAKVQLNFPPNNDAIAIPTQAIIPQARGKKVYVYNGGKAKFVDVTTGVRDSANVEITEGLKVGDTVLLTGLLTLKPDSKVNLSKLNGKPVAPQRTAGADSTKPVKK